MKSDWTDLREFLQGLYSCVPPEWWIEIRYSDHPEMKGRVRSLWRQAGEIPALVMDAARLVRTLPEHSMHLSVAPKVKPSGKIEHVTHFSGLWMDLDDARAREWCTGSDLKSLIHFGLCPSRVVSSGWGTHVYWFLPRLIPAADGVRMNRFLAWMCGGDQQAVCANHTLRLPGSRNCKGIPHKPTEFVEFDGPQKSKNQDISEILTSFMAKTIRGLRSRNPEESEALRRLLGMDNCENADEKMPVFVKTAPKAPDEPNSLLLKVPYMDVEELKTEVLRTSVQCPILERALQSPKDLSWGEWRSLASAFATLHGENGFPVFDGLSKLDTTRYNEEETRKTFVNALCGNHGKPMLPTSCRKMGILCRNACDNLMRPLTRLEHARATLKLHEERE